MFKYPGSAPTLGVLIILYKYIKVRRAWAKLYKRLVISSRIRRNRSAFDCCPPVPEVLFSVHDAHLLYFNILIRSVFGCIVHTIRSHHDRRIYAMKMNVSARARRAVHTSCRNVGKFFRTRKQLEKNILDNNNNNMTSYNSEIQCSVCRVVKNRRNSNEFYCNDEAVL